MVWLTLEPGRGFVTGGLGVASGLIEVGAAAWASSDEEKTEPNLVNYGQFLVMSPESLTTSSLIFLTKHRETVSVHTPKPSE